MTTKLETIDPISLDAVTGGADAPQPPQPPQLPQIPQLPLSPPLSDLARRAGQIAADVGRRVANWFTR
jgi:hypothetical protein